jgi:hypothetical protein
MDKNEENLIKTENQNTKKKRNVLLLISFILGVAYILYSIVYWIDVAGAGGSDAEQAGSVIATVIVIPHLLCAFLATLFNGLGYFFNKRGFALTGAILYTVSIVFMPMYFMFTVIQAILSYIGFAKLKKD